MSCFNYVLCLFGLSYTHLALGEAVYFKIMLPSILEKAQQKETVVSAMTIWTNSVYNMLEDYGGYRLYNRKESASFSTSCNSQHSSTSYYSICLSIALSPTPSFSPFFSFAISVSPSPLAFANPINLPAPLLGSRPLLRFKNAISPLCRWLRRHTFFPPPNNRCFAHNRASSTLLPRALDKYVGCSESQKKKTR